MLPVKRYCSSIRVTFTSRVLPERSSDRVTASPGWRGSSADRRSSTVRTGVPSNLAALVRHVHALGYGAQAEHAADREAVTLAARAGLDPFGLVSALVQVNALGDSDLQFADAHPQSRLRLDHLEQAMARRHDPQAGTKAAVTIEQRLESSTLK